MITYKFKVQIDTGHITFRTMYAQGTDYEDASEKVFDKLGSEFANQVAFFNIVDFNRV
jgi:hypothetical protein